MIMKFPIFYFFIFIFIRFTMKYKGKLLMLKCGGHIR